MPDKLLYILQCIGVFKFGVFPGVITPEAMRFMSTSEDWFWFSRTEGGATVIRLQQIGVCQNRWRHKHINSVLLLAQLEGGDNSSAPHV